MKTSYIGYATDHSIREKATSGGVGSAIIKYLFDNGLTDYAMSFGFVSPEVGYKPVLVSDFSDYKICGSIYHEMEFLKELKRQLPKRHGGGKIVLCTLPCQTKAVKRICKDLGYDAIIIGLTCSSQQDYGATTYLLKRLGVDINDVIVIQYRGNGWPSGIQIKLKSGEDILVPNLNSVWTDIFHSRLFIQKRCFHCSNTLNDDADITLADPWLPEYVNSEKIGKTLFSSNTEIGERLILQCLNEGYIKAEEIDNSKFIESQGITIRRKQSYAHHPKVRKMMMKVFLSSRYKKLVKHPLLFKIHNRIKEKIEELIT
ncbi:MAG: Coenzyme F420 hydrogenase/dehydrogenase, beta subunit C-terminal domain [Bacteroidales bacterium]|nr:Coenzyme F420 hydrogenase/dehydrogenase, beta subunit C-terminal domain [Bacteroidales bacterium]